MRKEFGPFTEDQDQALSTLTSHITQRIAGSLARELKELPEGQAAANACPSCGRGQMVIIETVPAMPVDQEGQGRAPSLACAGSDAS